MFDTSDNFPAFTGHLYVYCCWNWKHYNKILAPKNCNRKRNMKQRVSPLSTNISGKKWQLRQLLWSQMRSLEMTQPPQCGFTRSTSVQQHCYLEVWRMVERPTSDNCHNNVVCSFESLNVHRFNMFPFIFNHYTLYHFSHSSCLISCALLGFPNSWVSHFPLVCQRNRIFS